MRLFSRSRLAGPFAVLAVAVSTPATAAGILSDWSFEIQGAASTTNYCYMNAASGGGSACASGAWSGSGSVGIEKSSNTAWPGIPSPDGNYYGFVQSSGSILQQVFTVANGANYSLSWIDAGRPASGFLVDGNQSYRVDLLSGSVSASTSSGTPLYALYSGSVTSGDGWHMRTSAPIYLSAGATYTLRITGQTFGDHTVYVDGFNLALPEPATWGMMLSGLFMVAFARRRSRSAAMAI